MRLECPCNHCRSPHALFSRGSASRASPRQAILSGQALCKPSTRLSNFEVSSPRGKSSRSDPTCVCLRISFLVWKLVVPRDARSCPSRFENVIPIGLMATAISILYQPHTKQDVLQMFALVRCQAAQRYRAQQLGHSHGAHLKNPRWRLYLQARPAFTHHAAVTLGDSASATKERVWRTTPRLAYSDVIHKQRGQGENRSADCQAMGLNASLDGRCPASPIAATTLTAHPDACADMDMASTASLEGENIILLCGIRFEREATFLTPVIADWWSLALGRT